MVPRGGFYFFGDGGERRHRHADIFALLLAGVKHSEGAMTAHQRNAKGGPQAGHICTPHKRSNAQQRINTAT